MLELAYPNYFQVRTVKTTGVIYAHNGQVYISHLLNGERIGLEEIDDGVWDIYFGPIRLGYFDVRHQKGINTPYWTINV